MSSIYQKPIIEIWAGEIQALAKRDYGVTLSERELQAVKNTFNTELHRVDDGGWEGVVAHFANVISSAIGLVIEDHRKSRVLHKKGGF